MERRIKNKIIDYISKLKSDIVDICSTKEISESEKNSIINYINNYNVLELTREDFVRRKRVKNIVPYYERCKANRANKERCTRRKKDNEEYCGTHSKGQPHGIIENENEEKTFKIVSVQAKDIKGIIYYIDNNNNVYEPNDIMKGVKNPKVIAKYEYKNGIYSIPEFNI
jgi:hypothetical protein